MKEMCKKLSSEGLKNCPFCEHHAELWEYEHTAKGVWLKGACCSNEDCPMNLPGSGFEKETRKEAKTLWNKRPLEGEMGKKMSEDEKLFPDVKNDREDGQIERRIMPPRLTEALKTFPLREPDRIVKGSDGEWLAEWHSDGIYFEIEDSPENDSLEIMTQTDGEIAHWILK